MQEYNVNHTTSLPHYPQSNRLAEKFVQIVKNLFHKTREEGADLFKVLMIYRNNLLASNLQSSMQMLQSRTVKVTIANVKCSKETAWIANRNAQDQDKKMNICHHMTYA